MRRSWSLKARLALGAALLGAGTLLTAAILWAGMGAVADRMGKALASEARIGSYAALSSQAAGFLVVATEAVQTGLPAEERAARLAPVEGQLRSSFTGLRNEVERAVVAAESLGLDAQSRYGTQSLGIARMEALLAATTRTLSQDIDDPAVLRASIDQFSSGFDGLLSQAVNSELLFRNAVLAGIETLRARLRLTALVIAGLTLVLVAGFYFALIRPQFARLDRLRRAARQIGAEDFAVALPTDQRDEIGQLYAETNRMAGALAARRDEVAAEAARLNDTIAERTEALRAANATLSEIDENRRRFFADVSHELRTPLTVILMEAQLGTQGAGDARAAFATIQDRAARLTRRIEDLLRVARSESGQLQLDPQPVALPALLQDVRKEIAAEVDSAGMEFTPSDAPEIMIEADANWLRQVLVSLIRNAIRHARAGGKIALRVAERKAEVAISVLDNGPGIAPEDQTRVFERFAQGGAGNAQGFGIGLALAAWVVEAQGGAIELTSPVPPSEALGTAPGTKITVRLPRRAR